MDRDKALAELDELRHRVAVLERSLAGSEASPTAWAPSNYYTTYHVLAGMVLGLIGAASSLLFNVVGAAMMNEHPLQLIRVYLTFPLGESALGLSSGFSLAAGCCLYLGTGMIGGIPFHLVLTRYFSGSSWPVKFLAASVLAIGVWIVNYYGILSWLQPALIGGNWIVEQVPIVVAVLTHLIFGWTLVLVHQWGAFSPPAKAAVGR